jgi:hypothetical protein
MTDSMETNLREALAQRAGDVPEAATSRLVHRALGRGRHRRARLAIPVGLLGAGGATAALVLSLVGPGVGSAYASWNASPTAPAAGQVPAAADTCLAAVLAGVQTAATQNSTASLFDTTASDWTVDITDVRGAYTLEALSASVGSVSDRASCLADTSGSGSPTVILSAHVSTGGTNPAERSISIGFGGGSASSGGSVAIHGWLSSSGGGSNSGVPSGTVQSPFIGSSMASAGFAIGEAATDVTGVTLNLSDGSTVVASVGNGYYAAWWPGSATLASALVTSPSGTTTVNFELPPNTVVRTGGPSGAS